jgi:prepilin-type N-terminal cleavage/methylation domain-containing protein
MIVTGRRQPDGGGVDLSPLARRPRFTTRRDGSDAGFTLIELLLVMVVLPILMGAVVAVIITSLDDQSSVATRLADSADSQVTSAFYVRDVQSAAYMTTTSSPTSTPWTTPSTCGTGSSLVLGLEWPSGSSQDVVSYWQSNLSSAADGASTAGSRSFTSATASIAVGDVGKGIVETDSRGVIPFGTTVSGISPTTHTLTLSSALSTTQTSISFVLAPQLVRNFCSGSSTATTTAVSQDFFAPTTQAVITCASGAPATCSGSSTTWEPTTGVSSITLAIKEPSGQYNYALTGVPRIVSGATGSTTGGGGGQTIPPFLMLGGGDVVNQSSGSITVDGNAVINGGYFNQSNGTFTVTGTGNSIETTDSPASSACTPSPATCKNISVSSVTSISPAVDDPLKSVADPTQGTSRGCPSGGTLSGTVTLQPGEYTCALTAETSANVTLQAGVYELDGGLSMSSNTSLTGFGVLLYVPCNSANTGYGQDTWAPSCSGTLSLQSAKVNVSPLTGTSAYAGLWYWQNGGDANQINLKGPSATVTFGGFLYAPGAIVSLQSGTNGMVMGGTIASGIQMQNGSAEITGG